MCTMVFNAQLQFVPYCKRYKKQQQQQQQLHVMLLYLWQHWVSYSKEVMNYYIFNSVIRLLIINNF